MYDIIKKNKSLGAMVFVNGFIKSIRKDILAWLLILPSLICFAVFLWQPILSAIYLSFFETKGFEALRFVGFDNYKNIINDSLFIKVMLNTFAYVFWSLVIGFCLPIVSSIILNEITYLKGFFRMALYFPNMVPGIAMAVMWKIMFDPSSGGLINMIIGKAGFGPSQWLQNSSLTIPLIITTMTWRGFGSTTILYLADLQSVNTDLYEAASIDGAGFFKKLLNITLPHMSGLIKVAFIMQIISVFKIYAEPLAMTSGGPGNASVSLAMLAYQYAFTYFQVDKSVAVSVIVCIILSLFTLLYFKAISVKERE